MKIIKNKAAKTVKLLAALCLCMSVVQAGDFYHCTFFSQDEKDNKKDHLRDMAWYVSDTSDLETKSLAASPFKITFQQRNQAKKDVLNKVIVENKSMVLNFTRFVDKSQLLSAIDDSYDELYEEIGKIDDANHSRHAYNPTAERQNWIVEYPYSETVRKKAYAVCQITQTVIAEGVKILPQIHAAMCLVGPSWSAGNTKDNGSCTMM